MAHNFRGSFAVTVTPFTEDGSRIDVPAWRKFLDWQLAEGVPGIIILGTTGEFLTLTDDERAEFVEATVKHINKRIPVLVGTMNAYTPRAVRNSVEAERLGADGGCRGLRAGHSGTPSGCPRDSRSSGILRSHATRSHPADEQGKPVVGRTANPWRAAEA